MERHLIKLRMEEQALKRESDKRSKSRLKDVGLYRPAHRWTFDGGIEMGEPPVRDELDLGEDHEG